jgi:hypothetical protein
MLKLIIGLVLLAHGIGHSMGLLQIFKVATVNPAWDGGSWILTGVAGTTATHVVGAVLWIVAMIGFALAAGVVVGWLPAAWWQPVAIVASIASLAGLVLFPNAFPVVSTLGAAVVDVAVLVAVLWFHWVPADLPA